LAIKRQTLDLDKIYIYRIFHIDNLEYILNLGKFTTYQSVEADPNYKGIGEGELINLRASHSVITDNSNKTYFPSQDFLPFYFGFRSVMLYRIKTGHKVSMVNQESIVYVVCKLSNIISDIEYLFTDGHGYARITRWFDDINFKEEVPWEIVNSKDWHNTEEDGDRQRKKQAEFWVKNELPLTKIMGFAVYSEQAKEKVMALCEKYQKENIVVKVKKDYYY